MRNEIARRVSRPIRLGILVALPLVGSFVLYGFVTAQTPGQDTQWMVLVQFESKDCPGRYYSINASISFNGSKAEIKQGSDWVRVNPGPHTISSLSVSDYPGAKMLEVQIRSIRGTKTYPVDDSGSARVELGPELFDPAMRPTVAIVTNCPGKEEKSDQGDADKDKEMVKVLVTVTCGDIYTVNDAKVSIGSVKVDMSNPPRSESMVEVPAGTYDVHVDRPSQRDQPAFPVKAFYLSAPDSPPRRYGPGDRFALESNPNSAVYRLSILLEGCGVAEEGNPSSVRPSVAKIIKVTGDVAISKEGEYDLPFRPETGYELKGGEIITAGPNGSVVLESVDGHNITVQESSRVRITQVTTRSGPQQLETIVQTGTVQIERTDDGKSGQSPGMSVETPNLKASEKETNYTVSYDETTGVTTVGVEEGEVEVTPANSSLQPFTLAANQQVQVTETSVSAITTFYGSGSKTGRILLYVGIGVLGLVVLVGLYYFFRRQHRLAMRPAYYPAGASPPISNPAAPVLAPAANQSSQRCPNPSCGKIALAGKQFCAHCGTSLNV